MLATAVDHAGNAFAADPSRSPDLARLLALHSCALGLLYARTGRRDSAASSQTQAQALDPACPLLTELSSLLLPAEAHDPA